MTIASPGHYPPFLFIFLTHFILRISAKYDCYDTRCWGKGLARNMSIPCDNSYNYCIVNRAGLPLCERADSFHQWLGHGVHCYGNYKCGTDIRGAAICQDQDYTKLAVFIIIACLIIFLGVLAFCCYARRVAGEEDNSGWGEEGVTHIILPEYNEMLVRSTDHPDRWRAPVNETTYLTVGRNKQVAYPYYTLI